jgi:peptide chain release factor 1
VEAFCLNADMSILDKIQKEYDDLMEKLAHPEKITEWDTLGEQKKILEKIVNKKKEFESLKERIKENKEIIESKSDKELLSIAEEETEQLEKEKEKVVEELKRLIAEKQGEDDDGSSVRGSAIIEIRAGAGGDEASLFVRDLLEMYTRYAQTKNIEVKVIDENKNEQGGYKIITVRMKNGNPHSLMRYEAGVHRVQRVPSTEKQGRVHTSTVSVAVLSEPKKGKIKINPADIRLETCKSSGPGGQYVNKRETAVRIVHAPTGIVVTSQNERSLAQNKETAMSVLEAKLLEKQIQEKKEKEERERKSQIGTAMRSEKIRTYNYMQNRITDHRIEQSWYNLEGIMNGDLDEVIDTLKKYEEKEKYKDIIIE